MDLTKSLKFFSVIVGVAVVNIIVFSPGFFGVSITGGSPLGAATGVCLLLASALSLVYSAYHSFFKLPVAPVVKHIDDVEGYIEALQHYKSIKTLQPEISLALSQIDRIEKKTNTLSNVLRQRFSPTEMSFQKFSSVATEVENLFYLNVRSVLNRLSVFDDSEYESVMNPKNSRLNTELLDERRRVYQDYVSFVKDSLDTNEEILLKIDKLLLEIARLDSFEPGDIENMACMKEIDSLIKQTKLYKS